MLPVEKPLLFGWKWSFFVSFFCTQAHQDFKASEPRSHRERPPTSPKFGHFWSTTFHPTDGFRSLWDVAGYQRNILFMRMILKPEEGLFWRLRPPCLKLFGLLLLLSWYRRELGRPLLRLTCKRTGAEISSSSPLFLSAFQSFFKGLSDNTQELYTVSIIYIFSTLCILFSQVSLLL